MVNDFEYYERILLNNRVFTFKDAGVVPREISYWKKKGVIYMYHDDPSQWQRLNILELFWIRLVKRLRYYNVSLDTIKEIMINFFGKHNLRELVDQLLASKLPELGKVNLKDIPAESLEAAREIYVPRIFLFLMGMLHSQESLTLIVALKPGGGKKGLEKHDEFPWMGVLAMSILPLIYSDRAERQILEGDHIAIRLNDLLQDTLSSSPAIINEGTIEVLSKTEKRIMNYLRKENYKSITIRYDKNNKPSLLELTEVKKTDRSAKLLEVIRAADYQDIIVKTQGGGIIYFENTRKERL